MNTATIIMAVFVLVILMVLPVQGQIISPAPCNSDSLWGCYPNRVYVPFVVPAATPPVIVTPTPTPLPPTTTPTLAPPMPTIILISPTP